MNIEYLWDWVYSCCYNPNYGFIFRSFLLIIWTNIYIILERVQKTPQKREKIKTEILHKNILNAEMFDVHLNVCMCSRVNNRYIYPFSYTHAIPISRMEQGRI